MKEADTYLQVQVLKAELDSYRAQLKVNRKGLTEVLPALQEVAPTPPESRAAELSRFLEANDCLSPTVTDKKYCFQLVRLQLIAVTEQLDKANLETWAAKRTIKQLVDNINVIIDGLGDRSNAIGSFTQEATPK